MITAPLKSSSLSSITIAPRKSSSLLLDEVHTVLPIIIAPLKSSSLLFMFVNSFTIDVRAVAIDVGVCIGIRRYCHWCWYLDWYSPLLPLVLIFALVFAAGAIGVGVCIGVRRCCHWCWCLHWCSSLLPLVLVFVFVLTAVAIGVGVGWHSIDGFNEDMESDLTIWWIVLLYFTLKKLLLKMCKRFVDVVVSMAPGNYITMLME